MLVIGAGQLSKYLAQIAVGLDYQVTVCDPREEYIETWDIPGIALVDRGLRPLKGFAQPRHLLAVAWRPTDETIVLTTELDEDAEQT